MHRVPSRTFVQLLCRSFVGPVSRRVVRLSARGRSASATAWARTSRSGTHLSTRLCILLRSAADRAPTRRALAERHSGLRRPRRVVLQLNATHGALRKFPPHFFHGGKKRTPNRRLEPGFGGSPARSPISICPARTRNIPRTEVNRPMFAVAKHKASSPHEWHSFSRLVCCCGLLDRLAFAWLWQEPLMNWISA